MQSWLHKFETVGINPRIDLTEDDLAEVEEIDDAVDELVALGSLDGDGMPLSEHIWHFDTECIYDEDDYAAIALRLVRLTGGLLQLEELYDFVDLDEEVAWLSFVFQGKKMKLNFKVDSDWAETDIFIHFSEILKEISSELRFTYCDLGGQDCLIGCATEEQVQRIAQATGVQFKWLVTD